MKVKLVNVKNKYLEFISLDTPMSIDIEKKEHLKSLEKSKEYDLDISFYSFIWYSPKDKSWSTLINNGCVPYAFINTYIEEIIDINLNDEYPYVKFKGSINNQPLVFTLCYPKRSEDDEPIKETFYVGEQIIGLFKGTINE